MSKQMNTAVDRLACQQMHIWNLLPLYFYIALERSNAQKIWTVLREAEDIGAWCFSIGLLTGARLELHFHFLSLVLRWLYDYTHRCTTFVLLL
jgi:hypothetical protein